jgi:hypothetical protein
MVPKKQRKEATKRTEVRRRSLLVLATVDSIVALGLAVYAYATRRSPTNLQLATSLPYALRFIDAGLIPVVIDRGYTVGDTYLTLNKDLLYSARDCFIGDLIEKRDITAFAVDLSFENTADIQAALNVIKLTDLSSHASDLSGVAIRFGDSDGKVQYELTSIARLESGLTSDTNKCSEVRAMFASFRSGKQFDGSKDSKIIVVSQVYKGSQEITISGRFKDALAAKQSLQRDGIVAGASIDAKTAGNENITITIKKDSQEAFAVRPALILADISQTLGPGQSLAPEEYWRPFDPEIKPSDVDRLKKMLLNAP